MRDKSEVKKLPIRTKVATVIIMIFIPALIALGMTVWNDRKYYLVSILIILLSMLPFFMIFEHRKPKARELVIIAVLSAIAIAGRVAFYMVPQFKPVVAVVIISGVTMGAEAGFMTGAVVGFVSNMFFGQGPWTPWQMFGFGIIGFLSGILFAKGKLKAKTIPLCIFGGLATFFIYGLIVDTSSVFMFNVKPNLQSILAVYASGVPFNLIHALSTVIFLAILSKPMISKLDRIKVKYGLLEIDSFNESASCDDSESGISTITSDDIKRVTLPVLEFRDNFCDDKFIEYCHECPLYGNNHSCPPVPFDRDELFNQYTTAIVCYAECDATSRQIQKKQAEKIISAEYQGGMLFSAGSCVTCSECTKKIGEPCRYGEFYYTAETLCIDAAKILSELFDKQLVFGGSTEAMVFVVLIND